MTIRPKISVTLQASGLPISALPVKRVRAGESNKFVILVDPVTDGAQYLQVIEIFDVGGRTPPNTHHAADESFWVLAGVGEAICGDRTVALRPGDRLFVPRGTPHVVANTGPTRLYCLTTLVPDDELGDLLRAGVVDQLDAEDLQALNLGCG